MTNERLIEEAGRRLARAAPGARVRSLEVALDVVVVSASHADEWGNVPGTMVNEALREGRVLVDA